MTSGDGGNVGIMLVSHSPRLAAGLAEMVRQVAGPDVLVSIIRSPDPDLLGTSSEDVLVALRQAPPGAGMVILMDIGSSVLAARAALDRLAAADRDGFRLIDGPLVEGAVAAAAVAATGATLEEVAEAAAAAAHVAKL